MSQISQTYLPYFLPPSLVRGSSPSTSTNAAAQSQAANTSAAATTAVVNNGERKDSKNVMELLRRVLVLGGIIGISNSFVCQLMRLYGNKVEF